jgi:hypothetical protein
MADVPGYQWRFPCLPSFQSLATPLVTMFLVLEFATAAFYQSSSTLKCKVTLTCHSFWGNGVVKIVLSSIEGDYRCHLQCSANSICWGQEDYQCEECRYFSYTNRCVPNCSGLTDETGKTNVLVHTNWPERLCIPCDSQCLGGCSRGPVC